MKTTTKARVQVLLEINLTDTWGEDCKLEQVFKQARDSALNIISQKIVGTGMNIKMVGEPEIEAIVVPQIR